MIARCTRTRRSDLADHQQGRFAGVGDDAFPLTIGADYVVVAMGIWETILHFLVEVDDGGPLWCPAGLFDCESQPMPTHWEFVLDEGVTASGADLWTQWIARWGYAEIIRDPAHGNALMERDPEAMAIFKRELDRRTADEE